MGHVLRASLIEAICMDICIVETPVKNAGVSSEVCQSECRPPSGCNADQRWGLTGVTPEHERTLIVDQFLLIYDGQRAAVDCQGLVLPGAGMSWKYPRSGRPGRAFLPQISGSLTRRVVGDILYMTIRTQIQIGHLPASSIRLP